MSTPAPLPVPSARPEQVVLVLGLVTAGRVTTLGWLADDSAHAPDAGLRIELARLAARQLTGHDGVARLAEQGSGDLATAAAPHLDLLSGITARSRPTDWWERLVRTTVAGGVVGDLARLLLDQVPEPVRSAAAVATSDDHTELVGASMAHVAGSHPALAARLALWGRRVAGEALGVVQPALSRLAADGGPEQDTAAVLGALSTEHARRMERLGLAA